MRRRTWLAAVPLTLQMAWAAAQAPAQQRLALTIGNAAYARQPLRNPVNDARAMGAALRELRFDVQVLEDAGLREMIGALQTFSSKAQRYPVRLLFFAGHGLQIRGRNYLIPVDAEIGAAEDVMRQSVDVGDLLVRLGEPRDSINIVILDACRTNPFVTQPAVDAQGRRLRARTPGALGLADVEASRGNFLAYATAPGAVAMDRGDQAHSVYTRHLLRHIATPGLPIESLFKRVRLAVAQDTQHLQVPWDSSSLTGDFCFSLSAQGRCGS